MYNRYQGNTGKVSRVEEKGRQEPQYRGGSRQIREQKPQGSTVRPAQERQPRPVAAPQANQIRPPGPLKGLSGELGRFLGKLSPLELETEDLMLLMMLYLMYKDSGDSELLWIMAGLFLF